jgi:hypothetical protein
MAHNAACLCTECQAQQPTAGQMRGVEPAIVETLRAEGVAELRGPVMPPPPGTEAGLLLGWVDLHVPGLGRTATPVVVCDDGRSRAIYYDDNTGAMRAVVVLVVA